MKKKLSVSETEAKENNMLENINRMYRNMIKQGAYFNISDSYTDSEGNRCVRIEIDDE